MTQGGPRKGREQRPTFHQLQVDWPMCAPWNHYPQYCATGRSKRWRGPLETAQRAHTLSLCFSFSLSLPPPPPPPLPSFLPPSLSPSPSCPLLSLPLLASPLLRGPPPTQECQPGTYLKSPWGRAVALPAVSGPPSSSSPSYPPPVISDSGPTCV